ncbi:endonuclease/exonuclease/phosphatase family protein, partial [Thiolapillus sp.]|uniref:endonuclease/exonuclease/phosphatase family protein n=2 Tax=Thiolapillus sp. TaxID=2017437 RepID=UPI003AF7EAB7
MMTSPSPKFHLLSESGLRVGHLNVYHLLNKVPDISSFLNIEHPCIHLLGLSETRLDYRMSDESIEIPQYFTFRRDAVKQGETGLAIYIHSSIQSITTRRSDLESQSVESLWVEISHSKSPSLLVGFIYRNPTATYAWYDEFLVMLDKVADSKKNILLLGDFNIDLSKSHSAWESTYSLVGLHQLVNKPTRVTSTTDTLIDHIYTNRQDLLHNVSVPNIGISDHYPVLCTWSMKLPRHAPKGHTTIQYRTFKRFNKDIFLFDISCAPFSNVYSFNDPDDAMLAWYNIFMPIIDKHAPLRKKRVKHPKLPPWLTKDVIGAMAIRDRLKKEKKFDDFKKQRNRVKSLVRSAKKAYFDRLVETDKSTSMIWKAINEITNKSNRKTDNTTPPISPNVFNTHFLTLAETLAQSSGCTTDNFVCSTLLSNLCGKKLKPDDNFSIPPMTVLDVGKCISMMANNKSTGRDNISPCLLKLALPYIVEPLTYIYNLSIQKNVFPTVLKKAKVIPLPKVKDLSEPNNFRPISILPLLSKPIERHVHKHLLKFFNERDLLSHSQSGFRPKHSCHTALTKLFDNWLTAINNSE